MSGRVEIRRELRPGDLGEIVAQQARAYSRAIGFDSSFEAYVASTVAEAAARGWPGEREGVWIVERVGSFAGCLALTEEEDRGVLRWFLLDPALRGQGLGRRLLAELISKAEHAGFERLRLETFSELRVAAHLYRSHGFEIVKQSTGPLWGREDMTYQHYELELSAGAGRGAVHEAGAAPVAMQPAPHADSRL